ncbi:helix-turn-helix domain-containing protein [Alicyclobacillus fastidiosus]|nr:helix-turn-helix transcriptional regulator [Alicyclobacillus fastidiosus]
MHQNLEQFLSIQPGSVPENSLRNTIEHVSKLLTKGNKAELARRLGIRVGRFASLSEGTTLPHLMELLKICQLFNINPEDLFFTPCEKWVNTQDFKEIAVASEESGQRRYVSKDEARRYLESIVNDKNNFLSLTQISKNLGVHSITLKKNFPELTTIITQKRLYRIHKAKKPKGKRRKINWPQIAEELVQMLNDGDITESVRAIGTRLNFPFPGLMREYPQIHEEITKRYALYREKERKRLFDEKANNIRKTVMELRSQNLQPTLKLVQERVGQTLSIDLIKVWRRAVQTDLNENF